MRMLLAATVALFIAAPGASAQILPEPGCPPIAWCHPDGEGVHAGDHAGRQDADHDKNAFARR